MKSFQFVGPVAASKSLVNRALIAKSYFPELEIVGDSNCDDVLFMKSALRELNSKRHVDCGDGGTTLRFLALRASRGLGSYFLSGSKRLLERPQAELITVMKELEVYASIQEQGIEIKTNGWQAPKGPLRVGVSQSSQFLSAVLLNAWDIDFDLEVQGDAESASKGYLEMTIGLLQELGMEINETVLEEKTIYKIPKKQKVSKEKIFLEPDMSSCFSIAAAAAVSGEARIHSFPLRSMQPDYGFLEIFKKMKIPFAHSKSGTFSVKTCDRFYGVNLDLSSSPDLFPVLAVLCALAEGKSELRGATQLVFKESNRIEKTAELLSKCGFEIQVHRDGATIFGSGSERSRSKKLLATEIVNFDPDHDHRMAMAAGILQLAGFGIQIENESVVNKSFPEFWSIIRGTQ